MANGFDPYALAQGLIDTTEAGYGAQQAQKMGDISTVEQVGQMGEEFQKDILSSEREQERILNKQRKPGLLEQLAPIAAMFIPGGPLISGLISGAMGMYSAKKGEKHAKGKIAKARGLTGLDPKWARTLFGKEAIVEESKKDTMLDKLREQTKVSDLSLLTTGLEDAVKGYAMGEAGEGVTASIKNVKLQKALEGADIDLENIDVDKLNKFKAEHFDKSWMPGAGDVKIEDLAKSGKLMEDPRYLKQIFADLKDPDNLLKGDGSGEKAMKYLALLADMAGGEDYVPSE